MASEDSWRVETVWISKPGEEGRMGDEEEANRDGVVDVSLSSWLLEEEASSLM